MVLEDLTDTFRPNVRTRGAATLQADAVELSEITPHRVVGTVQGTAPYVTLLAFQDGELSLSCSCPFFESSGPCKHLWATILAVDQRRGLVDMAPLRAIRLAPSVPESDEPTVVKTPPPPPWKSLLQPQRSRWREDRESAPRWTGRLLYVADVERSREGDLVLQLLERGQKKSGAPTKPRPASIPIGAIGSLEDPIDRQMLPLLFGASVIADELGASSSYAVDQDDTLRPHLHVPATMAEAVLPLLSTSARLYVRASREADLVPARYDGVPWDFVLGLRRSGDDATTEIVGTLRRGLETMDLAAPLVLSPEGWLVLPDSIGRFQHFGAMGIVTALRSQEKVVIPISEERPFLAALMEQPGLPRLDLPEGLALREVAVPPRSVLRFEGAISQEPRWGADKDRLGARLSFDYQGREIPSTDERPAVALVEEGLLLRRDREAEAEALQRLTQLGFRAAHVSYAAPENKGLFEVTPQKMPAAVRALTLEGWHVEAKGKAYRTASHFTFSVASGIDWFDLTAKADFGGVTASLPRLLRALKRGESTIVLDDGSVGMLPEAWLAKHALLGSMGVVDGDTVRFTRRQAGLLDALLLAEPAAAVDDVFQKARDQLARFAGVPAQAAPSGFQGELRPYQEAGLGWLGFLRGFGFGGCLADDMGLGKTVQVLALLEAQRASTETDPPTKRPSMVVVPKSLVWNWRQEAARFTPRLNVLSHVGAERTADVAVLAAADLVVTTYGTMRADITLLREIEFDTVILDEAQAIKNAASESAKAARLLRSRHRLALSGTPIENHIGELWSLFEFLNPGLLGAARAFEGVTKRGRPTPETIELLSRALRPFILRRTKEVVAPELPPKHEETILCELEAPQRRLYDELRDHYRAGLLGKLNTEGDTALGKSKILVIEALLRLRQASCHPGLIDKRRAGEASAKLDVLLPRLEEVRAEGHKALVFSQFTSFLAILRERLDELGVPYQYLDGAVEDRAARVARFQEDPTQPLFLISLKAGGVGLNLTAADYVFILDPWWNPAVEAQAVDRAHRIGQSKRVFVYRLLCRDTVEEKVAALQETKRGLADSIIGGSQSLVRDLDRETLELLLS